MRLYELVVSPEAVLIANEEQCMQERNFFQRYGGHLMLLAVGVVLFLGLRLGDWGRWLAFELEAPVEVAPAGSPSTSVEAISPAATAAPEVDIASLPVLAR